MFKQLDIFGSQILLRFQGEPTYRTKTGSVATLLIIAFIGIRLFFIIKDVFLRSNPQVIYNERQVDDPAPFVISSETFPLAFGMQDSNFNHYIDESIYTIIARHYERTQLMNETSQQHYFTQKFTDIKLQPCTLENFKNPDNLKYYTALNYQNMYCLPPDLKITIEGDFFSPKYSELQIIMVKCQKNCKSDDVLDQYLLNANFAMQITDSYVDPSSKNQPFSIYSRNLFWPTSTQMPKLVSVFYRNNYVQSDFGWFLPDLITQRNPAFSFNDVSVYPDKFQNYFLDIIIRCEKQKEGSYSRTYKNFNNIMSEIGGFTQSFLAIGYLICSRLSQLQLNQNLINQAFNYEDSNEEQKKNFERKSILQQKVELLNQSQMSPSVKNSILKQPENFTSPDNVNRTKKRSQFIQNCQSSKLISDLQFDPSQSQQQPHNQDQKNYSIDNSRYKKELENVDSPKRAKRNDSQKNISSKKSDKKKILNMMIHDELEVEENSPGGKNEGILDQSAQIKLQKQKLKVKQMEQKLKEDRFKQLMDQETKCMKMSIWEYFKSKIYPFGALKQKKQVIEYSIDKLYYNLDIFNILKKLTEVEKLKRLILDHEQLKLFDYLPKPTIHSDLVLNKNQGQEQNRKAYETDILYQDHRTEMKKVKDAFHAYKKIVGKQNHSFLDQRIIDLLDPNLVSIFQAQGGSFEYNMPIQKQSTDEMFEQSRRYKFNQFQTRVKTEQIRLYNLQTETQQQNLITKLDQVIEKQQSTNPVSPLDQSPPLINDSFPFLLNLQSLEQRQIKNLANQNQEQVSKNNSNQILEDQMKDLAQSIYNDVAIEQYQEIPNQFQRNVKCYNDQDQ